MTSEQRKAIEASIGRTLTAEEIGRGSVNRPQSAMTWEQEKAARRAAIAAANQQQSPPQPRWIESTLEHDGAPPQKRETRKQAFKRLRESQEQRADTQDSAANLANDPVYNRMNQVAAKTVDRLRWDASHPESAWERAIQMQQAAKVNDTETFQALNKAHVAYLESITTEKQSAIDAEIAQLQQVRQSFSEDRYEEPSPAPDSSSYSHIRRTSGMMQLVNKVDGFISEYDPRVPQAREFAEQQLVQHQADTTGKYGESIPMPQGI